MRGPRCSGVPARSSPVKPPCSTCKLTQVKARAISRVIGARPRTCDRHLERRAANGCRSGSEPTDVPAPRKQQYPPPIRFISQGSIDPVVAIPAPSSVQDCPACSWRGRTARLVATAAESGLNFRHHLHCACGTAYVFRDRARAVRWRSDPCAPPPGTHPIADARSRRSPFAKFLNFRNQQREERSRTLRRTSSDDGEHFRAQMAEQS